MPRIRNTVLVPMLLAASALTAPFAQADPADTALATVGEPDATVVIDVYEDYMCPFSAAFEREFGDRIDKAAADGKLRVRYHMLHFLDRVSASKDYSSRAAGAALAVFQSDPGAFAAFHKRLFAKGTQPKENGASDLNNDQLAKIADQAGAAEASADVRGGEEIADAQSLAAASTEELSEALGDKVGVPTVLQDGKAVDVDDKHWLGKLIR